MNIGTSGKRIGFALSTIHFGSSLKLWFKLANYASQEKGSFFIFPGSNLSDSGANSLFNEIYKLVNSENLDGLISWASSISNGVSYEKSVEFHKKFENLPFVTIGQKINGAPSVSFDAYEGMKELTKHLIEVHGAKKIAFIRGPKNHTSAQDRFRGFFDAVKEAGILDENLISDYTDWYESEKGAVQLYNERNLVPGKDFDALLCASDMIALSSVECFEKHGYKVPKDYICGGFNDSVESRVSPVSLSTVHMPMEKLGVVAYQKLVQLLNGEKVEDTVLPAYPVIRESCGCNNLKHLQNFYDSKKRIKNRDDFVEAISKLFHADEKEREEFIQPLFEALFENNQSDFYRRLSDVLTVYFKKEGELFTLYEALRLFKNSTFLPEEYVTKVISTVNLIIPQIQRKICELRTFSEKNASIVSSLKSTLLAAHDFDALMKILSDYLPKIGIRSTALVLYEEDGTSRYVGGFNPSGELCLEEKFFSSKLLVPEEFKKDFEYGVYLVQPLFMENKPLGYMINGYSDCDGSVYEGLRVSVGNTIQNILLFKEIDKARQKAEKAEFAKTEFFANVGSELCDPLKDLSAKIFQMQGNIEKGIVDQDILTEQLIFLRSQIQSQLHKTVTLVELTRSQVDDLPMDKKLFDIRQVLPGSVVASLNQKFPLVYGDPDRLKKALLTFFGDGKGTMSLSAGYEGLKISLKTKHLDWKDPEFLLAEKIILLQYGEVQKIDDESLLIILPWPNLAGLPPVKMEKSPKNVINLSSKETISEIFDMPVVNFDALADDKLENAVLYWRSDNAPIDEWVKVYSLRHNENLFRAPILCYSHELISHNFVEMLESKVRAQKSAPVLFINAKRTNYGTWATDSNSVKIQSMAEFEHILEEITPSLIVFESIDEESIKKIRKNPKTVLVPIIVLPETISSEEEVELLCAHPRIILCNSGAADSEQFDSRIHEILAGDEIMPPHTGALVKKAILYLNKNASQQIVRWKLADTVHVSEDYLTRIFHKEIGLSLWEYLNRYRIFLATKMLLETNDTIYEIAEKSGFQDQAYFCRVFKKVYGIPPGKIRTKQ